MADFKVPARTAMDVRALAYSRPAIFADTMYERIATQIKDFEDDLNPDEEVGARLASFGQTVLIAIEDIRFHNPHLIIIDGVTPEGDRCTLLQHMNQVNILLVALKAKGEPRRIGFKLVKEAKDEAKNEDPE
jgi:hypothetical protein